MIVGTGKFFLLCNIFNFLCFFLGALHVPLIARLLRHVAQMLALGCDFLSGETVLQAENFTGRK